MTMTHEAAPAMGRCGGAGDAAILLAQPAPTRTLLPTDRRHLVQVMVRK